MFFKSWLYIVEAKAVITADVRVIGGRKKNLNETIVKALSSGDTSVEFVLVANRNSDTHIDEVSLLASVHFETMMGICC